MLNLFYCAIFVVLLWVPFVWYHTQVNGVISWLHTGVTLFNAINAMICIWEIALYRHSALIQEHYEKSLKPKYGQKFPPGFFLLDSVSFSEALTLKHWSQIWSTYALLDPAYADSKTFQFWVDVGNGHFFLIPTLLFSACVTVDSSFVSELLTVRNQAIITLVMNYVMIHGTFLYYASYLHSKKWVGCSTGAMVFVSFCNGLWVFFPSVAIYCCYHAIQDNSWQIFY
jgi:hypothetical protein